jgi:hypothetical protein
LLILGCKCALLAPRKMLPGAYQITRGEMVARELMMARDDGE